MLQWLQLHQQHTSYQWLHDIIPVRRTGQRKGVWYFIVPHSAESIDLCPINAVLRAKCGLSCLPVYSGDFSVTPKAVSFTDLLCFGEQRRILRSGTRDKSCLTPQVRVMALRVRWCLQMLGLIWKQAAFGTKRRRRDSHTPGLSRIINFSWLEDPRALCIYHALVFIAAAATDLLQLLCMKVKGALDHFNFSHIRSSPRSQQGQI